MEEEEVKKLELKKSGDGDGYIVRGNLIEGTGEILLKEFGKSSGSFKMDLSGVTITNSLGIKEWIEAMSSLNQNVKFEFFCCPPAIVHTLNMIPSFAAANKVGSVLGTFYCSNCETPKNHEVIIGKDIDAQKMELSINLECESCGQGELELEVGVEEYFEFLEAI